MINDGLREVVFTVAFIYFVVASVSLLLDIRIGCLVSVLEAVTVVTYCSCMGRNSWSVSPPHTMNIPSVVCLSQGRCERCSCLRL